jgi:hypothetical protein
MRNLGRIPRYDMAALTGDITRPKYPILTYGLLPKNYSTAPQSMPIRKERDA